MVLVERQDVVSRGVSGPMALESERSDPKRVAKTMMRVVWMVGVCCEKFGCLKVDRVDFVSRRSWDDELLSIREVRSTVWPMLASTDS